ncbi:hypothetical protein ACW05P_002964 [Acinetobacter baumannii]
MAIYTFLMTYSVSPVNAHDKDVADRIRERIADLDGTNNWVKLKDVETTFKGDITLTRPTTSGKIEEAREKIKGDLSTVFDAQNPSDKVWISVAFLVDGLGEVKDFKF